MKNQNDDETVKECANCHRKLELAHDLLSVEKGVIGPRGVVPLGDILLFCDEECLAAYFADEKKEIEKLPRRIP